MSVTIRHCSISHASRSGININEGTFGGHLIEFCDVFDTVQQTGDHGSFNSWGRDRFWNLQDVPPGKLTELALLDCVKPNILRNSRWRCDHGWAIDLDDGSSNYDISNNLLLSGTNGRGGLKFREGFHRKAHNNIIINNSFHPHVWYQDIDHAPGVYLATVATGSKAEQAGLLANDFITAINGTPVAEPKDLILALAREAGSNAVTLTLRRQQKDTPFTLKPPFVRPVAK